MNESLVRQINDSPYKAFFSITGGGQSFLGDYCKIAGASKTLIGGFIPYDKEILHKTIGKVDSYSCSDTARKLAVYSYNECLSANIMPSAAIGFGVSCSLATESERKGRKHKIYIAAQTDYSTDVIEVILNQRRTRVQEEALVSNLILQLLAHKSDIETFPGRPLIDDREVFTHDVAIVSPRVDNLSKNKNIFYVNDLNKFKNDKRIVIYSGSWNPLHEGHLAVAKLAEEILRQPVFFDLSIRNAEKGTLDFISIRDRIKQISSYPHIISNTPLFEDKATVFRSGIDKTTEIIFVVGADTWNRIWDSRYCGDALNLEQRFYLRGVKFLVFGRKWVEIDKFHGTSVRIRSIRAETFYSDNSSSEIRKQQLTT
jgi:nicotinic acid mononucleotide adenylyltransferase/nicotinamide mononucleotide (NMN) deamidase PncC